MDSDLEPTEEQKACLEQAKNEMIKTAVEPFYNPEVRNYIENVRRSHDQIIDNVNIDEVINVGYDTDVQAAADRTCLLYTSRCV